MNPIDTTVAATTDVRGDHLGTVAAVGLLAYLSADLAHHMLGHGGACLALGGQVVRLSSIFVDCTVTGTAVDLAGPFANLAVGLAALASARYLGLGGRPGLRLFLILAAGFNLLWFFLQLLFSAASRTDDFAWAMHEYHVDGWQRYALIAVGGLGYLWSIRAVAVEMMGFAHPRARAQRIVLTSWLVAGGIACLTALVDRQPMAALIQHAAPQSFLLSIGLLFVPAWAAKRPSAAVPAVGFSLPWVLAASAMAAASVALLGPGLPL